MRGITRFDERDRLAPLARFGEQLAGDRGALKPILERLAIQLRAWLEEIFTTQGERFGGWQKMSVPNLLMRRKGKGTQRVGSYEEARALADNTPVLQDTGRLRASFTGNGAGSVKDIGMLSVTVGSSLPYAYALHTGGPGLAQARFDEKRFDARVSKTLTGAKPPDSKAKKNWNPWYFIQKNAMKKAMREGKTFPLPARQMVHTSFNLEEYEVIVGHIEDGVQKIIVEFERSAA